MYILFTCFRQCGRTGGPQRHLSVSHRRLRVCIESTEAIQIVKYLKIYLTREPIFLCYFFIIFQSVTSECFFLLQH